MKKNKTKIILLAVCLSMIIFVGTVYSSGASLSVSPANSTKTAGDTFNASVGVNAGGNKVCAVEGTLSFNNLSCQNITVANGLMAQSAPTCSNPYFLIGIPNCSTVDKTLLTASVKAGSAGSASVSVASVDIVGEGVSVGSAGANGNYTINAISTLTPTPTSTSKSTKETTTSTEQTTIDTETSADPNIETSDNNLIANLGATGATSSWAYAFWVLLALNIIYALAHGTYHFKKKRKQK